jgi:DNA-binding IclR family transcriptional regulator
VCRRFASKGENKFEGLPYRLSNRGSPIITGAVAWIDCDLHEVHEAGDHYIVQGLVRELQIETAGLPLLFFQGGYGRFIPSSLAAADPVGNLALQLRQVDVARPEMERIAAELQACCIATARVDREVIIAASAGTSNRGLLPTLVGQRLPFMPPTGNVFVAWESEKQIDRYLATGRAAESADAARAALTAVRERGYSLGLRNDAQRRFATTLELLAQQGDVAPSVDLREMVHELSYDPPEFSPRVEKDVRLISAPVFAQNCAVAFALTLYGFRKPSEQTGIRAHIYRLLESAARVTALIGGRAPDL